MYIYSVAIASAGIAVGITKWDSLKCSSVCRIYTLSCCSFEGIQMC